jgi:hypothetical protein
VVGRDDHTGLLLGRYWRGCEFVAVGSLELRGPSKASSRVLRSLGPAGRYGHPTEVGTPDARLTTLSVSVRDGRVGRWILPVRGDDRDGLSNHGRSARFAP